MCQIENQQSPFYLVNRATLNHSYIPYKSFRILGLFSPNIYEIGLSNEVLNIDFCQEAAKISEIKVGGRKKHLPINPV